jgi:hypothetical protein
MIFGQLPTTAAAPGRGPARLPGTPIRVPEPNTQARYGSAASSPGRYTTQAASYRSGGPKPTYPCAIRPLPAADPNRVGRVPFDDFYRILRDQQLSYLRSDGTLEAADLSNYLSTHRVHPRLVLHFGESKRIE